MFDQTPGNVGEYHVELSAQGLDNIEKALGTNYAYPQVAADVTTKGTLTINQGEATVTLNSGDSKTYDAKQTLPSGLNLNKYNVTYDATVYSADGEAQTLKLTADDLQIVGNATNVGTYQVKLSQAGQEKLKQLTGNNGANYKWTFKTTANYIVTAATADAKLNGSNQKTFDGTAVTTAQVNSNGQILVHFTFPGSTTESTYALQDGDYIWNAGSAPVNAGTYTITLNKQSILAHLQDSLKKQVNANVTISADDLGGQASFTITPKTITDITISGSDQSKTYNGKSADLDVNGLKITANGTVTNTPLVNPGITASDFTWYDAAGKKLDGVPTDAGTYQAHLNANTLVALQKANPNYKLNISSKAKFTLDATLTIEFEDTQEGNKQVGQTITKSGVAGSTVDNLDLKLPENYELAPDQELPTSYTFGKALSQNLYIKLVHKTAIVDPTDSATNPTKDESWFKKNDLVKDVTRTINYEGLSEEQLAQISEDQKKQTVEFTRTAVYDLVTGKLVANSEGQWTAVDGKDTFAGFTPKEFAGYTTNPNKVEQVKVTGNDKDSEVTVTYTVNTQTGKISYVDSDGKEVGQTPLSGKTGEAVDVIPQAPAGWKIVSGQDIPKTVVATADGIPTVTVRVEHDTIIVTPETPSGDVPTGPVPGDPSKNYDHLDTLTKTPTRTITVVTPSGAKLVITQKVTFTRTATFDKVTGKVTYSEWKVDGNTQWDAYTAPTFSGYTASQSKVAAEKVSVDTADSNIKITYKQDEVPTPEPKPDKPAKPNKESEKKHNHSKANKKGYDSNNNPKYEGMPTGRNKRANGPVKAADAESGKRTIGKAERKQLANKLNAKPKSVQDLLPQTGSEHKHTLGLIGTLLAGLGWISLLGVEKRKKKDE
ncbi:MAG TPA: LPXTG cell wall anchor domain-containing protein [Lactobacillus crispatus]|uniref:LPXTG cell wall anchor domain-containing protein n=1 Tax=Lactobacillus crispatus TaxID=47770 RepID=A0A921K577_9LACO|nr:LPXTG cell wall anchor domain-containing protein [Lactobacillus crispatus]